jgi:hypothetical protein
MKNQVALVLTTTDQLYVDKFEVGDSLRTLQFYTNGYVECVQLRNGIDMWVNEDGIALGLDYNPTATAIYWTTYGFMSGQIFGNVVFTSCNEDGETTGLIKEQGDYLREIAFDVVGIKPQLMPESQQMSDLYAIL